jgi:uncharacterized ion transporter superfamily protein YfcC
MENKKTLKVILITLTIYMLLSWFIVSGYFSDGKFTSTGFNQFGLLDFLLAPFSLFNYYVVSMTKRIDSYVNQVAYGNMILAFISIGIFYGVLNKTGAYSNLVNSIKNKFKKRENVLLYTTAIIYCLVSSLTGLNLILFMYFPFICAVLSKLKFNKLTIFFSTIGAMLIGQLASTFNPTINGLNRVLFGTKLTTNLVPKLILLVLSLVVIIITLWLKDDNKVKKEEEILLLDEDEKVSKKVKKNYYPIVIVTSIVTLILFVCMYNWYYMFNSTKVTMAYYNLYDKGIHGYKLFRNIFGTGEAFGYFTGFTMSALLMLASLVLGFLYKLKLDNILEGAKDGIKQMIPTVSLSVISLTIIVVSLYNSNSFIYAIANNIFNLFGNKIIPGVLLSGALHNFFINDYFALLSSFTVPFTTVFDASKINITLLTAQVAHGFISLITPLNVFLIAGLAYLKIPYTKWIKYAFKTLLILLILSISTLLIATLLV